MPELSDEVHAQLKSLCTEGDLLAEQGDYDEAADLYWEALALLPDPKSQWEAATGILGAIADANFLAGEYEDGRDNLQLAMHCPGAPANPFLRLRLGQCQFELAQLDRAADELAQAYRAAGSEIFEEEDAKYLAFLMTRIEPPPGGW